MIEINLLPGKKKAAKGTGVSLAMPDFKGLVAQVKDPWLLGAIAAWVIVGGGGAALFITERARLASAEARLENVKTEKRRYDIVIAQKRQAEKVRDSLVYEINVIRDIDADRYIWPHVLDEVSKALPPYTWLSSLAFMGTPQGSINVAAGAKPDAGGDDKAKKKSKKVDVEIPRDEVRIRMIGLTPDIQALTRFMRQLESSPFFADVQLNNSQLASDQGKDVTQFTLDVTYTRPDTSVIRRIPLSATGK